MATPSLVDRPFPDLDVPDVLDTAQRDVVEHGSVAAPYDETEQPDDRLSPARGILFGLLLCTPFWIGVYWLLS